MSKLLRDMMRRRKRQEEQAQAGPAPAPAQPSQTVTRTVAVLADHRQYVLGHEGRALKGLLSSCGVRVAVPVDSPVRVTGSPRRVEAAVDYIHKLVRRARNTVGVVRQVSMRPQQRRAALTFTAEEARAFQQQFPGVDFLFQNKNKAKHCEYVSVVGPDERLVAGAAAFLEARVAQVV